MAQMYKQYTETASCFEKTGTGMCYFNTRKWPVMSANIRTTWCEINHLPLILSG